MKKYIFGRWRPVPFPHWCDTGKEGSINPRHTLGDSYEVVWDVALDRAKPHYDHIEMTGFEVSTIISYGVTKKGRLRIHRHVIFPTLRMYPNDTRGALSHTFSNNPFSSFTLNGEPLGYEYPQTITIDGYVKIESITASGVSVVRSIYPSTDKRAILEEITFQNTSTRDIQIEAPSKEYKELTKKRESVNGPYEISVEMIRPRDGAGIVLSPQQKITFTAVSQAKSLDESSATPITPEDEWCKRTNFLSGIDNSLILKTPNETINGMFRMAKRRTSESIIQTKGGLMHAPGGGAYYAALWTNDQCEYVNPLFPLLGYPQGSEQAINCYKQFMRYMKNDYSEPLVSSIVAEGESYWNGAGDRGDGAMFAYGASRFALAYGSFSVAQELWAGIEWSLEYSLRKINEYGVIESDSDELENRFESSNANLFTSCLLYDALISTGYLVQETGFGERDSQWYFTRSLELKNAIEAYFGGVVEGFPTYQYYKGNTVLRSWICMPLVVGIFDRTKGTLDALYSDRLWSKNGLYTEAGTKTFWDRSTLFALRGTFIAGDPDRALHYLESYSTRRLLGEHVPYAVEAYPEGNQAQLAGESALYVRVITEGVFGIRPTGFNSFHITPQLPKSWSTAMLENIHVGNKVVSLNLIREGRDIRVIVLEAEREVINQLTECGNALTVTIE